METEKLHQFLTQWINKAVVNGGFNATEARDALQVLDALAQRANQTAQLNGEGKTEPATAKK